MADAVTVTSLPVSEPPLPSGGGRFLSNKGELAMLVDKEPFRHLVYLEMLADGQPRGNHFHRKKREYLYIIEGTVDVTSVDLDTQEHSNFTLKAGDVMYSPPNNAHVFNAKEHSRAIEFSPQPFDATDTIPYQVT